MQEDRGRCRETEGGAGRHREVQGDIRRRRETGDSRKTQREAEVSRGIQWKTGECIRIQREAKGHRELEAEGHREAEPGRRQWDTQGGTERGRGVAIETAMKRTVHCDTAWFPA